MRKVVLISMALAACAPHTSQQPAPATINAAPVSPAPAATPAPERTAATTADDPFFTLQHMDWPGPNSFRSASGEPGPDYWQQRADYTIAATLDTTAQSVTGTVTIRYTNNSPDSLRFVWLQVDQNLYAPGSKGSAMFPADSRWGVRGFKGGYQITGLTVDGKPASNHVDDTMMRIDLDTPLAPKGGKLTIAMQYSFRVPEHGSDRMGRDGQLYEIAQWYPRMATYDDVRGWNTDPYLGQGEFYLEYGDIDYTVTAPAGYTIAGSGVLQNPADVLTATERQRLAVAAKSDTVVRIITQDEAAAKVTAGTKSWHFHADHVRDVAWAGAPDFRWDATSWKGVLTQAYYEFPKAGKAWESGAEITQWTIRTYSTLFFPFPYPQATSVAGPVGGMEYPMFVMVHYGREDASSIFSTIDHEHGHEWFPMIVGSNERRYAWQDEGFNTYINAFSNERRYPTQPEWPSYMNNWQRVKVAGIGSPLMTAPDHIDPAALGAIGYRKPAVVLLTLRNAVLGPDVFDKAFREYIRRWAFKHPTPGDFFRTVENVSGEDLQWFWRDFFYSDDVLDIGVDGVTDTTKDGERFVTIALRRNTSIVFPVTMRLKLADGTTRDEHLPVDIWARDARRFDATFAIDQQVVGVRLFPGGSVPDWNSTNDTWGDAPAADSAGLATAGGLMGPIPAR